MEGFADKKKGKTAKVRCDVKNCIYHNHDYMCEAGEITVGPNYAKDTSETICATFKHKDKD